MFVSISLRQSPPMDSGSDRLFPGVFRKHRLENVIRPAPRLARSMNDIPGKSACRFLRKSNHADQLSRRSPCRDTPDGVDDANRIRGDTAVWHYLHLALLSEPVHMFSTWRRAR